MGIVKHAQSSQNKKLALSLKCIRKEVKKTKKATYWFNYTHVKQMWSGVAEYAQCAYTDF